MVYITGDLHGDLARLSAPDMRQVKKGDTLIVCGDFGFIWNGDRREKMCIRGRIGSGSTATLPFGTYISGFRKPGGLTL